MSSHVIMKMINGILPLLPLAANDPNIGTHIFEWLFFCRGSYYEFTFLMTNFL